MLGIIKKVIGGKIEITVLLYKFIGSPISYIIHSPGPHLSNAWRRARKSAEEAGKWSKVCNNFHTGNQWVS